MVAYIHPQMYSLFGHLDDNFKNKKKNIKKTKRRKLTRVLFSIHVLDNVYLHQQWVRNTKKGMHAFSASAGKMTSFVPSHVHRFIFHVYEHESSYLFCYPVIRFGSSFDFILCTEKGSANMLSPDALELQNHRSCIDSHVATARSLAILIGAYMNNKIVQFPSHKYGN